MAEEMESSWGIVMETTRNGKLMDLLNKIPRQSWENFNKKMAPYSLLLAACNQEDVRPAIALILHGFDVNQGNIEIPVFSAIQNSKSRTLEILIAVGADLNKVLGPFNRTPFQWIFSVYFDSRHMECAKKMIANGKRFHKLPNDIKRIYTIHKNQQIKTILDFEEQIINCRNVIVVLLGLKKRKRILPQLDRFLIQQELAVAIWSTRTDEK